MLIFSEPKPFGSDIPRAIISIVLFFLVLALAGILWFKRAKRVLGFIQIVSCMSLVLLSVFNFAETEKGFSALLSKRESNGGSPEKNLSLEQAFSFSKSDNNVLLIMLDCVVGAYVPYIFEENPGLLDVYSDFTWYPNTVSYASHTLVGALPIYGGYEYTPESVNVKTDVTLLEKQREAYLLLPTLFSDIGYKATVTDPPFDNYALSNLSIFAGDERISAQNLSGKYTHQWMQSHPEVHMLNISAVLNERMIRFSVFKILPLFMRSFVYDEGDWLMFELMSGNGITPMVTDDYALLDLLPELTGFHEKGGTYTAIYSHLPHGSVFLQAPDYVPVDTVTEYGTTIFKNERRFHATMSSFVRLHRFFQYLKDQGAYANTRIILVSDHGRGNADYPGNITLPNGEKLQTYNCLLMVKEIGVTDTNSGGTASEPDFMTNADAALFALDGIIENPVNPWTKNSITADKKNGAAITTIGP
jgi:hypothetical protein